MITLDEYFHDSVMNFAYLPTDTDRERADDLLTRVNALLEDFGEMRDVRSGHRTRDKSLKLIAAGYKAALGGNHEKCFAVDVVDNDNDLDVYLTDEMLTSYGLYREHPDATDTWVHLQSVPPKSGNRTFVP